MMKFLDEIENPSIFYSRRKEVIEYKKGTETSVISVSKETQIHLADACSRRKKSFILMSTVVDQTMLPVDGTSTKHDEVFTHLSLALLLHRCPVCRKTSSVVI